MTSHSVDPALPADDPTGIVTDHEIAGILQDARNGDPNAAEALFRHLQPRMLSVALKQVTGHADAEDAVADAWEAIYRELTDFAGPPHHWLSRAFSITRNRAIDLRRHNDRHVTRQVDELSACPAARTRPRPRSADWRSRLSFTTFATSRRPRHAHLPRGGSMG